MVNVIVTQSFYNLLTILMIIADKCPEQKFATKQALMKHGLTHAPLERVWRCPQCTLSFEALWRLQQHLFSTHLEYRYKND